LLIPGCCFKNNGLFTTRPTHYMYNFSKWGSVHSNTPSTSNLWWHSDIRGIFSFNLLRGAGCFCFTAGVSMK
jgi:hypothetical protein